MDASRLEKVTFIVIPASISSKRALDPDQGLYARRRFIQRDLSATRPRRRPESRLLKWPAGVAINHSPRRKQQEKQLVFLSACVFNTRKRTDTTLRGLSLTDVLTLCFCLRRVAQLSWSVELWSGSGLRPGDGTEPRRDEEKTGLTSRSESGADPEAHCFRNKTESFGWID